MGRLPEDYARSGHVVAETKVPLETVKIPETPTDDAEPIECPTCGAYVLNEAFHSDWHARLNAALIEAARYKPPPTYFGHTPEELAEELNR